MHVSSVFSSAFRIIHHHGERKGDREHQSFSAQRNGPEDPLQRAHNHKANLMVCEFFSSFSLFFRFLFFDSNRFESFQSNKQTNKQTKKKQEQQLKIHQPENGLSL